MGALGSSVRVVLVLALVTCASAKFAGFNGEPRPKNMEDKPTASLGSKPAVTYNNKPASCIWYDWENPQFLVKDTKNCSTLLWESLSAADPSTLEAYTYYFADIFAVGPDEWLCVIGCFDLSAAGGPGPAPATSPAPVKAPAATPPTTSAPPAISPVASSPLPSPPADAPVAPPTMTPPTPPPTATAPAPATLFRPPPPALSSPPSGSVLPPSGSVLPPSGSVLPPSTSIAPSEAPAPVSQTGAGNALHVYSAASILVVSAATFWVAL